MKKVWNKFLIISVWVAFATAFISAMFLDSTSWIPTILCGASVLWLAFMAIANKPKN